MASFGSERPQETDIAKPGLRLDLASAALLNDIKERESKSPNLFPFNASVSTSGKGRGRDGAAAGTKKQVKPEYYIPSLMDNCLGKKFNR